MYYGNYFFKFNVPKNHFMTHPRTFSSTVSRFFMSPKRLLINSLLIFIVSLSNSLHQTHNWFCEKLKEKHDARDEVSVTSGICADFFSADSDFLEQLFWLLTLLWWKVCKFRYIFIERNLVLTSSLTIPGVLLTTHKFMIIHWININHIAKLYSSI